MKASVLAPYYDQMKLCTESSFLSEEYKYEVNLFKKERSIESTENNKESFFTASEWKINQNARLYSMMKMLAALNKKCVYIVSPVSYTHLDVYKRQGLTQNKCIVEVEGKYTGSSPTLDEKRRSVTSAKKACRVFKTIYEELEREYGVVFDSISDIPPSEQTIVMKASTEAKDGRKIQKNHMSQRTFQCSGEGK